MTLGANPTGVTVADLLGDGRLDLLGRQRLRATC